jgi:hypothetical protein
MVILVLSAAVLMSLTVFIGMLVFSIAAMKLVDTIHNRHMEDMRYHVTRMTDQVLAISEANLIEIQGRRDAEIDRAKAENAETFDLFRQAAASNGTVPRVDDGDGFDYSHDMDEDGR